MRDAELGTTTRCDYCGTELHLPEIGPPREEPPAPAPAPVIEPVAASVEASPKVGAAVVGGVTIIAVFGAIMMYVLSLRGSSASQADPSPSPTIDPSARATLSASKCFSDCIQRCNVGGPNGPTCMDNCDAKCGLTKPARR